MSATTYRRQMDFGIGEFLKYFEEHFGKPVTKVFVAFIALALVGVCAGLIWEHILYPIYLGFQWLFSGSPVHISFFVDVLPGIVSGVVGFLLYLILIQFALKYISPKWDKLGADLKKSKIEIETAKNDLKQIQKQLEDYGEFVNEERKEIIKKLTPPSSTSDKP